MRYDYFEASYTKTLYSPVSAYSVDIEVTISFKAEVGLIKRESRAAPLSGEQTKADASAQKSKGEAR